MYPVCSPCILFLDFRAVMSVMHWPFCPAFISCCYQHVFYFVQINMDGWNCMPEFSWRQYNISGFSEQFQKTTWTWTWTATTDGSTLGQVVSEEPRCRASKTSRIKFQCFNRMHYTTWSRCHECCVNFDWSILSASVYFGSDFVITAAPSTVAKSGYYVFGWRLYD